jgi:predicted O-methyltransferase YrrM
MEPIDVDGLISDDQGRIMQQYAAEMVNDVAVEIGSYRGKSACYIGRAMPKTAHLHCIDPWADSLGVYEEQYRTEENFEVFKGNVRMCGLEFRVTPLRYFSHEVLEWWSDPISLLYIDGGHKYEEVLQDIDGFAPHVVSGGVILFDDYSEAFPGLMRAVNERFNDVILHDVGIYESKKKNREQRYLAAVRVP